VELSGAKGLVRKFIFCPKIEVLSGVFRLNFWFKLLAFSISLIFFQDCSKTNGETLHQRTFFGTDSISEIVIGYQIGFDQSFVWMKK
jgi:hypothetical protein